LGATYDELEWAMLEYEKNSSEKGYSEREKQVFAIFKKLHTVNLHKMRPIPVCIIPSNFKTS
jgi:NAD+ synthase